MKVVITTDCFLPRWDGIARFLSVLVPELALDMQVTVFAPKFKGEKPIIRGVKISRFPLVNIQFGDIHFSQPDKVAMSKAIKEADVVFNQTIGPVGIAAIKLARKHKKPIVSYIHSVEWELARGAVKRWKWLAEKLTKFVARRMYNKCSLLLVPSKAVEDKLSSIKVKTKMEVVHLGVDVRAFKPPKSKAAAKKKLKLNGKRVIGFVGRIAREKNLDTLYAAFDKLRLPKTVLLIVGEGLDVPKKRNIIAAGKQDDVIPYLQAMDVFVLPSLTETSSLSTMEAMAAGLPVIVTPVGNIREYVVDGKNGFMFPRKDADKLKGLLETVLTNQKLRRDVGKEARKTIVRTYSWKATAKKIKKALSTLSG